MDERELLADRFEADRTHLRAVAFRMLGSVSEADDAVQEAWLRLSRSDTSAVENLSGWLTTVGSSRWTCSPTARGCGSWTCREVRRERAGAPAARRRARAGFKRGSGS